MTKQNAIHAGKCKLEQLYKKEKRLIQRNFNESYFHFYHDSLPKKARVRQIKKQHHGFLYFIRGTPE